MYTAQHRGPRPSAQKPHAGTLTFGSCRHPCPASGRIQCPSHPSTRRGSQDTDRVDAPCSSVSVSSSSSRRNCFLSPWGRRRLVCQHSTGRSSQQYRPDPLSEGPRQLPAQCLGHDGTQRTCVHCFHNPCLEVESHVSGDPLSIGNWQEADRDGLTGVDGAVAGGREATEHQDDHESWDHTNEELPDDISQGG